MKMTIKKEMEKASKLKETKKKDIEGAIKGISTRGRIFEGKVTRKFPKRVVIEFERTKYDFKYERYSKARTRIHARLPENMDVAIGDYVTVRECRPLSKIIHFIVIKKINEKNLDLKKLQEDKK